MGVPNFSADQAHIHTMAAKKFRPSFFRHFKKIGVVHSLLSL
jgi:hypothetical protein